jgi:hypothetical protein
MPTHHLPLTPSEEQGEGIKLRKITWVHLGGDSLCVGCRHVVGDKKNKNSREKLGKDGNAQG